MLAKQQQRKIRHRRVRAKIKGTAKIPRLCVFRSNKYMYVQFIDDKKGSCTIFSIRGVNTVKGARELGKKIAEAAKEKNIEKVLFDRGGYKYHGRVRAVAEGAREGGLIF
ncbi:MAG: 50S ribosomal protein L18 [Candidatus Spechtbacterales bacterium]